MWWNCFPQGGAFESPSPRRSSTSARCKSTTQPSSCARGNALRECSGSCRRAALWQRLYREARSRGPVHAAECARHAGRHPRRPRRSQKVQRRHSSGSSWAQRPGRSLRRPIAHASSSRRSGLEGEASVAALEAVLAASLAATAPMPVMKSKREKRPAPRIVHARSTAARRSTLPARSLSIAAIIWRAGSLRCRPTCSNSSGYRRALRDLARRAGWQFDFLDEAALRRRSAGAFLAVARANQQRDAGIVRLRYRGAAAAQGRKTRARRQGHLLRHRRHQSQVAQEHVRHAHGHAGQRRRSRHAARAQRAARAVRHRLLARDHGERDRCARVPAAGSRARRERRDHPGRAQRCRGPHGAGRYARARRARAPGTDDRFRDAHGRLRQRADRALQRRIHQSPAVARSPARRRPQQRRAGLAAFRWTRTTTATSRVLDRRRPAMHARQQGRPHSRGALPQPLRAGRGALDSHRSGFQQPQAAASATCRPISPDLACDTR